MSLATQVVPSQKRAAGHLVHADESPLYTFGHAAHPGGGEDAVGVGGTSFAANY
jgi:hypothetical protein